ncbi:MAG: DUF6491 family protein [Pseudomonadota bacterium]
MKGKTKLLSTVILAASVTFAPPSYAAHSSSSVQSESIWIGSFGRLHNWRAISRDEIVVWASPSRPYLIKLSHRNPNLRFAHAIGVTSHTGRITKFESVIADGWRTPIESILALDRETAKTLRWKKKPGRKAR